MNTILLTGAGFSRNWGGWLASEVFEYILGCNGISESLKAELWLGRRTRHEYIEDTLSYLKEKEHKESIELEKHIITMFDDMNKGFDKTTFEFSQKKKKESRVATFLSHFDAIFTLNQDLLLETHYITNKVAKKFPNYKARWKGIYIPHIQEDENKKTIC